MELSNFSPPVLSHTSIPDKSDEVETRNIVRRYHNISRFSKCFPVSLPDYQAVIFISSNYGEPMKAKCYGSQNQYGNKKLL